MYLTSKINIDPSHETIITKVKAQKIFKKVLDVLSAGFTSKKEEQETFTAVVILQQLNRAFRSMGINNIVRLAKDDIDFYYDEQGIKDDLKEAMERFELKVSEFESELFKKLFLVLEHDDNLLKYLIEIDINRTHPVGEYPISIVINGINNELGKKEAESQAKFQARLEEKFKSQETYESFTTSSKNVFDNFIEKIEMEIRKNIQVDTIQIETESKVIRPKEKVQNLSGIKNARESDPFFYGYPGYNTFLLGAMMWSPFMYSHNIYCHNVSVVDTTGNSIMNVGDEGFYGGESNALNVDQDFEPPSSGDVDYFSDNEYSDELTESGANFSDENLETDEGGDNSSFWGGGDSDSTDSGSSCSSCSSCGGCGGD